MMNRRHRARWVDGGCIAAGLPLLRGVQRARRATVAAAAGNDSPRRHFGGRRAGRGGASASVRLAASSNCRRAAATATRPKQRCSAICSATSGSRAIRSRSTTKRTSAIIQTNNSVLSTAYSDLNRSRGFYRDAIKALRTYVAGKAGGDRRAVVHHGLLGDVARRAVLQRHSARRDGRHDVQSTRSR